MADEITKIIKIEAPGSEQTVKGLKKEIESLRDALLNTEKGSEEYKKILEQLIGDQKKLADAMSAGKNEVSAATGSYNALKNEMSALKKVWAEVSDEASRGEIGKRIDEINTELKSMDASIGNFQRNVGNYASGFKNARQELAALKTAMDNAEQGSEEYNAAFARAADITHTLQERQEMLKYSAADVGTQLSNVASIGASLAGGFNAINSVIALTGEKSEDLQKVMVKLQAGIALVQGLQGLEGMTKRMKGLVDGLTAMIFKTNETTAAVSTETVAVQANTTAQEANTVATAGATVATNAFGKALVATGIGAIIVLLGTLIAHWDEFKEMVGLSNEKLEQFQGIMDKVKTVLGGVANVIMNAFVAAVKNAITSITTLGEVTKDVLTFQFGKAAQAAKDGWKQIAENTKNGWDIVNNYNEGAAKTAAQIQEKRTLDTMKKSAEELNEVIKDNEAKKGSDWKYTEEGKKMYDEYFQKKLASYKKDSKEYKEAQREMWSYEREFNEKKKKGLESNSKAATAAANKELSEIETIKKRAEDAAKDEVEKLTEKYNKEKALLIKHNEDTTALDNEYLKNRQAIFDKIEKRVSETAKNELTVLQEKYRQEKAALEKNKEDTTALDAEYQENYQELLNRIVKSELELLEEKYNEEKEFFEKYEKDTTALTAEYEANKAKIIAENARKAEEARQKAKDDYTKKTLALSDRELRSADDTNTQKVTEIQLEYSLKESKQSGSLSFNDIIEETNKIYEANKKHLQAQAEEYKKLMEDNKLDEKARETAARDYTNTIMELQNLETQNMIDNNNLKREEVEEQIEMYRQLGDAIADIFGSIADLMEEDIKQKVKNGEITQEEGEKQFESVKAFQIAQATINTISGAIAAFMGCQSLGQPWGAIIGAVQAAAVTAAGVAQIAKIKNTQLGGGGSVSSAMQASAVQPEPEQYQPQYYQNPTGESEITKLADTIKDQKVYVVESEITEAQNRSKVRVTESTW